MELPRGLAGWRKSMWKFQGSFKKEVEFPRGVQEKIMQTFHGFWFLTLEFPRGVTQFCRISRSGKLLLSRISKGKLANLKIMGDLFRKVYPQPTLFRFFWNSPSSSELPLRYDLARWYTDFKIMMLPNYHGRYSRNEKASGKTF